MAEFPRAVFTGGKIRIGDVDMLALGCYLSENTEVNPTGLPDIVELRLGFLVSAVDVVGVPRAPRIEEPRVTVTGPADDPRVEP